MESIIVENISKRYRIPHHKKTTLFQNVIGIIKRQLTYEEFWALKDISFEVEQGQAFGIIGRNGSGKSTLLRQLGLLDRPTTGEIILDDISVTKLSDDVTSTLRLERLGYIFQEYALLAELTAHENVFLPGMMLSNEGVDYEKRAKELLETVGLGKRIFRRRATEGCYRSCSDQQPSSDFCRRAVRQPGHHLKQVGHGDPDQSQ